MRLKKLFIIFFFIFIFNSSFADTAGNQLALLLSRYQTYQADFIQYVYDQHHRVIQSSAGSMSLMRPGKFRWETLDPANTIVMTNGKLLWNYNVDLKQATVQPLQKGQDLNAALLLSGNVRKIITDFNVRSISKYHFEITPKSLNNNFIWVQLIFSNNRLSEMRVKNNLGQITVFKFNDILWMFLLFTKEASDESVTLDIYEIQGLLSY